MKRGKWEPFKDGPFETVPMGSVAFKMALVAAGLADATWTLVPKNEWDVAGGAALVKAAGGVVSRLDGSEPRFNNADTLFDGFLALPPGIVTEVRSVLDLPSPS